MRKLIFTIFILVPLISICQQQVNRVTVRNKITKEPISGVTVELLPGGEKKITDADGGVKITGADTRTIQIAFSAIGYKTDTLSLLPGILTREFLMTPSASDLGEVVITGTMRSVQRTASPVPVEVYTPKFFLKNPTPSIFDALQMVNGVRPQLNCNVCNTGDIHINGLEGPYTMILIDGMPIVSSLASVYGLSGIPNSLVERIEIVKGPASSLYGSEAIGGLINVITKNPLKAPQLSVDLSSTSWHEINADIAAKYRLGKKITSLAGISYFNYSKPFDKNNDGFTDITLQDRISIFNKFNLLRPDNRAANLAIRYVYEDRWGGEMNWNKKFRGTDSVYGETIYTSRFELTGNYQLPVKSPIVFSYSYNSHEQRSAYGTTIYNGLQHVGFGQLTWEKGSNNGKRHLLVGVVSRYTWYDDNSTATIDTLTRVNTPDKIFLPGIFVQNEWSGSPKQRVLVGLRYDYDKRHGNIFTPRIAWKYSLNSNDVLRVNAGTGFRVVNLFTEDHAALTGARAVVIEKKLKPEKSYNVNVNYLKKVQSQHGWMNVELTAWYTHFTNRIIPDYQTDPNKIIYNNLDGYAISKGVSVNTEMGFTNSLRITLGGTLMDVAVFTNSTTGSKVKETQLLTEKWTGTWTVSYFIPKIKVSVDYTGNIYGKMKLPLLSELDPRDLYSPVWSIQNLQFSKKLSNSFEIYGGIKNLLNWTPANNAPFLISRSEDPFDKKVIYNTEGKVVPTADNPYALTFDPNYVYAPNQGRRIFAGARYVFK